MAVGDVALLNDTFRDAHAHAYVQDERRPLLAPDSERGVVKRRHSTATPLPKGQLATLCALRLADPIAFTQIFPYVNEMMENFGVATNPSQTGFYSGLVESVFAFSQLISIYQWANVSDRIGRRPVVLIGTIGIAFTTILFGFSRTLATVLFSRALAGLFSGNVAVMHSVLGELTDSTNQAIAYPLYGLCWPLGVIVGPLIGGTFSNAAQKYPELFGNALFETFPYLLPCLVVASFIAISVVVGFFCLSETLPPKARPSLPRDYSISYGLSEHNDHLLSPEPTPNAGSLWSLPILRAVCISGFALSFVGTAFDVVFVLFCYSPIATGGLSFSVSQIGYALAVAGISSAALQLLFMPILLRHFNCSRLYKFCMSIWPLTFVLLPILNGIAKLGYDEDHNFMDSDTAVAVWIGIGIVLALSRIACLAFSLNLILVKEHAPGPSSLGTANGLSQFAQCLARAIAPAFVSSLFATSVDYKICGGHFWMVLMLFISVFSCLHALTVPEDTGIVDISKGFESI
ncbi:MFS general substrate transporter [Schizopora paradoxa]|uniref:MFS general substrate transporter n=1 Tax=Schizopora paradoxa TaxID=27342 RepID=A0A0H2RQM2_9AGAM|nr:MFS general substrate transporter [Schizopora paradoxa]